MDQVLVKKPRRKAVRPMLVVTEEQQQMVVKSENEDLNLHVSLCEQRYKELEGRLDAMDQRLIKVEDQISTLKKEMAVGFGDIKLLLEKQNSARFVQMTATFGTIAAAVIGVIGYIITH